MRSYLVIFLLFLNLPNSYSSLNERQLYRNLLKDYNYMVRPVSNPEKAVTVTMKVFLQQVLNVDAKQQMIEINAWIKYVWKDYRLTWQPELYDNITSVRFGEDQIWQPDILLYNRYIEDEQESFDSTYKTNTLVYYNGEVNWIPPGIFKISCKMDITLFPFDEQICFMKFGSWTYHGFALDLRIEKTPEMEDAADLSTYISNGEWHLLAAPAKRFENFYKCCKEPYPTIKFYFHLKRRTFFYMFNIIIPTLLVTFMSLLAFCLPATDLSEKIGLQTTILLSVCFFLTILSEMTPTTSEAVPLLGVLFSAFTFIVALSTTFTIIVLNIRYRQYSNHSMSPLFRRIFMEVLPWITFLKRPGYIYKRGRMSKEEDEKTQCSQCERTEKQLKGILRNDSSGESTSNIESISLNRKVGDGLFFQKRCAHHDQKRLEKFERTLRSCENEIKERGDEFSELVLRTLKLYEIIVSQVHQIKNKISTKQNKIEEEWKFAALAVDRFCLFLFTIVFVVCLLLFIMVPPITLIY